MSLTKKQYEVMNITMEECAEVIQALSKVFRFGLDGVHPESGTINKDHLITEMGDLYAMLGLLENHLQLDKNYILEAKIKKLEKLTKWSNIGG